MTNDKKRIAIYFTGGTISMKIDPALGAAVPALSGEDNTELAQLFAAAFISIAIEDATARRN